MQSISELEHILSDPDTEPPMTFILGARCKDGVVLISDKKVTLDYGADFDFRDKFFGDLRHVKLDLLARLTRLNIFGDT